MRGPMCSMNMPNSYLETGGAACRVSMFTTTRLGVASSVCRAVIDPFNPQHAATPASSKICLFMDLVIKTSVCPQSPFGAHLLSLRQFAPHVPGLSTGLVARTRGDSEHLS